MNTNNKNEIINIFKKNVGVYLSQERLQEIILCVSALFLNAKYINKSNFKDVQEKNEAIKILKRSNETKQKLVSEVYYLCKDVLDNSNICSIINYLNNLTKHELIDIICYNYEEYSRSSFSTPETISELSIKILERVSGKRVLDLCSYTGNFLTQYACKYKNYIYSGIEIDSRNNTLAKIKLFAQDVVSNIIQDDVLGYSFKRQYDKVFCDHPFMTRIDQGCYDRINQIEENINITFSKKMSPDWAYVCSTLNALSKSGKAIVIMPNGVLYKLTDQLIRKELVMKGYVEAVISMPGKLFNNTGIESSLLVLSHGNKKTKFIDASSLSNKKEYKIELNVDEIYKEYCNTKGSDITKIVGIKELEMKAYSFLVSNYITSEKIVINKPKKLCDVAEIFRGYQITSSEINKITEKKIDEVSCKVINISDINLGEVAQNLTEFYTTDKKINRYCLRNNDILIASKGTNNKLAVIKINNDEKYIASGNLNVIRLKEKDINPYYLEMFFESNKGQTLLNSIRSGGCLPALNITSLKNMEIPVPTLKEQQEVISKYLSYKKELKILKDKIVKIEDNMQAFINKQF